MSLLFNVLSRLLIAFLPRSKCLLISWLQLLSSVILELKKIKSVTASTFSASICCEVIGPGAMILGCFFFLAVLVLHCCAGFSLVAVSGDCSLVVVRQLLIAGEGNGNPLQCSCLENPRDGGAWWAAISGVTQSWT